MSSSGPPTVPSSSSGPCECGSALPYKLCCGSRASLPPRGAGLFTVQESPEVLAQEWDLALTTVQALAATLPDVPIPLLGGQTPRELYRAGAQERAAAVGFVRAVSRSAEAMGLALPVEPVMKALASSEKPHYTYEERQKLALAAFTLHLLARGVETAAVLGGQRLFRDVMKTLRPSLGDPLAWAAAIDLAVCWMHFRPEANEEYPEGRSEIAALYHVDSAKLASDFASMKRALKLVWFDPRYAVQDPAWQERLEQTARAIANGEDEEGE